MWVELQLARVSSISRRAFLLMCFCVTGLVSAGQGQSSHPVAEFIRELSNPDTGVRQRAAKALVGSTDPHAVVALIPALK